jgi:hypothetical protein
MVAAVVSSGLVAHRARGIVRLVATIVSAATDSTASVTLPAVYGKIVGCILDADTLGSACVLSVSDKKTAQLLFAITATDGDEFFVPAMIPSGIALGQPSTSDLEGSTIGAGINQQPVYVAGALTVAIASGTTLGAGSLTIIVDEGGGPTIGNVATK